jgi:hypothetical protein
MVIVEVICQLLHSTYALKWFEQMSASSIVDLPVHTVRHSKPTVDCFATAFQSFDLT